MPYIVKDKIAFLAESSKILSSSIDYNVTLAVLAKLVTTSIADFCIIDIMEGEKIKRLAVRVSDPKKNILAQRFTKFLPDPKNKYAIYDAAKSGRPILIKKITNKWLGAVSKIPQERKTVIDLGLISMIFAPLKSRGKVIGVLTVGSSQKNFSYSEEDAVFIEELAIRAGIAVDKAKLYHEAQEAVSLRDEFLSIATHELKTPLTSILLNLQLAQMKLRNATNKKVVSDEVIKLLETNIQQSRRMSRLINDLLNISVASSGRLQIEKETVDLSELITGLVDRYKAQLDKAGIKLSFKPKKGIYGEWDKLRIEQVVSNLISNAIKYGNKQPIKIVIGKNDHFAVMKIRDYGIGIADEDKGLIFERFKRAVAGKDYKGLGVGLYICRQIIEAHGGKLKVESKVGKGSIFTIALPLKTTN